MDTLPADWAIIAGYRRVFRHSNASDMNILSSYKVGEGGEELYARELARMIEKYEAHLAPVDPDILAVREILAAYNEAEGRSSDAGRYADGTYDRDATTLAAVDAFRKVMGRV